MINSISSFFHKQNSISINSSKINSATSDQAIKSNPMKLGSHLQEINFSNETTGKILHIDRNYNLMIKNDSVYSIPTNFGMVNYKFNSATYVSFTPYFLLAS